MDDSTMDTCLSQGVGELTDLPDINFELFDLNFSTGPLYPPEPANPFFFAPNINLPQQEGLRPVCDYHPTTQGAIDNLNLLVSSLLSQVTALQNQ
jgi:hypothetical protein